MTSPNNDRIDQKIDQHLLDWHAGLGCDDSQRDQMRARFLEQFAAAQSLQSSTHTAEKQPLLRTQSIANQHFWQLTSCVAAAAVVLLAVCVWQFSPPPALLQTETGFKPERASMGSFSADDILRSEQLYCELDRIFEHNVPMIHQSGDQIELDFETQALVTQRTSPIILRFVLQQAASGANWKTIHTEDVVGGHDHQFTLPHASGIVVKYWSHLLPDQSLWAEVTVSTPTTDTPTHSEQRCLSNVPQTVWSETHAGQSRQLILAYELLKPCEPGVF